jgi:hypothetical protein
MNIRRVIVSFVVLILIVTGIMIFLKLRNKNNPSIVLPLSTPTVEEQIESKLNGLVIPDDGNKIELKNVSNLEALGIATEKGVYANLPDLEEGEHYRVLLGNGTKTIVLGNLTKAKGGWILEHDLSKYVGYKQIFILKGEQRILEGSF